jgi:hypothetical protein
MDVQPNESSQASWSGALIEQVREGMLVVDRAGERLGDVAYVQMGDPQAATTQGNEERDTGFLADLARAVGGDESEPDVPEPLRSQLIRYGYIKVDGPGLADVDRYVRSDKIAAVRDRTVFVTLQKDDVPREH